MRDRLERLKKFLASFFKSEWTLSDYPLTVRELKANVQLPPGSRFKVVRCTAQILGWPSVHGHGDTREEAMQALANRFEKRIAAAKPPRPGTECFDITFASSDRLDQVEYLAPMFFALVIHGDYNHCTITDGSALYHFASDESKEALYFDRIEEIYGLDVRDITSGNIVEILERIEQRSPPGSLPRW
jgi:hypothetical protein